MEPQQWIELEPGKLATSPSSEGRSFQTSTGISHGCTTNTRVGALMEQSENAGDYEDSGDANTSLQSSTGTVLSFQHPMFSSL